MATADDFRSALRKLSELISAASQLLSELQQESRLVQKNPALNASANTEGGSHDEAQTRPSAAFGALDDEAAQLLKEAKESEFKTNDLVQITGSFLSLEKTLRINGMRPIRLNQAEFLFLKVLSAHALTRRGLSSPRRVIGGSFLGVDEVFQAVEEWRKDEPTLAAFWSQATFPTVHRTVWELRQKITDVGANPKLIETGPPGEGGYRLSTPPHNILIRCDDG